MISVDATRVRRDEHKRRVRTRNRPPTLLPRRRSHREVLIAPDVHAAAPSERLQHRPKPGSPLPVFARTAQKHNASVAGQLLDRYRASARRCTAGVSPTGIAPLGAPLRQLKEQRRNSAGGRKRSRRNLRPSRPTNRHHECQTANKRGRDGRRKRAPPGQILRPYPRESHRARLRPRRRQGDYLQPTTCLHLQFSTRIPRADQRCRNQNRQHLAPKPLAGPQLVDVDHFTRMTTE